VHVLERQRRQASFPVSLSHATTFAPGSPPTRAMTRSSTTMGAALADPRVQLRLVVLDVVVGPRQFRRRALRAARVPLRPSTYRRSPSTVGVAPGLRCASRPWPWRSPPATAASRAPCRSSRRAPAWRSPAGAVARLGARPNRQIHLAGGNRRTGEARPNGVRHSTFAAGRELLEIPVSFQRPCGLAAVLRQSSACAARIRSRRA